MSIFAGKKDTQEKHIPSQVKKVVTPPTKSPPNPLQPSPPPTVQNSNISNPFNSVPSSNLTPSTNSSTLSSEEIQNFIDETVEKVISGRWDELTAQVETVVKWKSLIEERQEKFEKDISSLSKKFEDFEKKILAKISSYDSNLLDVNSEMKALEKVFSKITPTLVYNVNELSKIVERFKSMPPPD